MEQTIPGYEEYVVNKKRESFFSRLTPTNLIFVLFGFVAVIFFLSKAGLDIKHFLVILIFAVFMMYLMSKYEPRQKIIPYNIQVSHLDHLIRWQQAMGILPQGQAYIVFDCDRHKWQGKVVDDYFHVVFRRFPGMERYDLLFKFDPNDGGAGFLGCRRIAAFPSAEELAQVRIPAWVDRLAKFSRGKSMQPFLPQGKNEEFESN